MATVQGIYVALFGRPADPEGLAFWNAETNDGQDLTGLIGRLTAEPEAVARFAGLSNDEIINSIYQALFNRDADAEGLATFKAALEDGSQTLETIAINILDGAQGSDLTIVNNKIAAANEWTNGLDTPEEIAAYAGEDAAAVGRAFLTPVTEDEATVPNAEATQLAINPLLSPDAGLAPAAGGGGGGAPANVAPVAEDFAIPGVIDADGSFSGTFVESPAAPNEFAIENFGTDADGPLTTASFTFDSATFNGKTISDLADAGLTFDNTAGTFSFDGTQSEIFNSLADGVESDFVAEFTVTDEDGATDTGSLTFTVRGVNTFTVDSASDDSGTYDTIADAVAAASAGQTIILLDGTHTLPAELDIDKEIHLVGQDQNTTIINGSALDVYGIHVQGSGSSFSNFTLMGPAGETGSLGDNFGFKIDPLGTDPGDRIEDITIENVTVKGSLRTELDINGGNNITLKNLTLDGEGTGGNGISLTDTANVSLEDITTLGNNWGAVALYNANRFYDQATGNITFSGENSFGELVKVYAQDSSNVTDLAGDPRNVGATDLGPVTGAGDFVIIFNGSSTTPSKFFFDTEQNLIDFWTNSGTFNLAAGRDTNDDGVLNEADDFVSVSSGNLAFTSSVNGSDVELVGITEIIAPVFVI